VSARTCGAATEAVRRASRDCGCARESVERQARHAKAPRDVVDLVRTDGVAEILSGDEPFRRLEWQNR
jgi:hypothetical protein